MSTVERHDRPCMDWGDASDWDNTSCVVALPHDTDRLHVGLEIRRTEAGCEADPRASDIKSIEKLWGRIYTRREQWVLENQRDDTTPVGDPPDRWYADEGTPGWMSSTECKDGYDEIWVVSWA